MSGQRAAQDFAGRVVIVIGAWRGLGHAAAECFHERGAEVAVNVHDRARAESLAASSYSIPHIGTAREVVDL